MLHVTAIAALKDNYIWVMTRPGSNAAAIIDPGAAAPVLSHLERMRLHPVAVLVTHHHGDHVDGIDALLDRYAIPVYGPAREHIPHRSVAVADGDVVDLEALQVRFTALHVPGHTLGAIAYHGAGALFSGDTLFTAGCGRLFEGTAADMFRSLQRLAALPADTALHCGHEYTAANLRFALAVEPQNQATRRRLAQVEAMRARGEPTVPAPLALELETNPFLRTHLDSLQSSVAREAGHPLDDEIAVFAALRAWKDRFT